MSDQKIIDQAISILESRLHNPEYVIQSPKDTSHYLKLHFEGLEHESFRVMFLNNQHGLIKTEELFRGTLDGATVYPREVVKAALQFNAAAVIFSHNHPSGVSEPSLADKELTKRLKEALRLIDVRVLDHIVVGGANSYSFAEHGLI